MLFPTDAYELVHADSHLANAVKHYYDLPEAKWLEAAPPFIVWTPTRDTFDANKPQQVKATYQGQVRSIEAPERCQAGHDVHLFVKRTSDLAGYRAMYSLLSRFRLALRYALNTTANYRTDGGQHGGEESRRKYPGFLHYTLRIAPYVPVIDVPGELSEVLSVEIVSSTSIDPDAE